eukprot:184337-Amphidinium_carterae.1
MTNDPPKIGKTRGKKLAFIDSAVVPTLGNTYEIWTVPEIAKKHTVVRVEVYIESWTDLDKIADTAHLIFGAQHPARRVPQSDIGSTAPNQVLPRSAV